jgi:hypothetical protein
MAASTINYCRVCLLPVLPDAEGVGETSFLFASLHCQCQRKKNESGVFGRDLAEGGFYKAKSNKERCLHCHKEIVPLGKIGSFTGFLFQEFRCKCAKPLPACGQTKPMSKALQGTLATQFFPHAANKTRLARLERQAANHTQMVLSGVKNVALQDLHSGESIANSYILEEQIGLGGMGAVYRARHQMLGRVCALKFLLPSAVSATSWEMFKKEAKILNELQHSAICRIFDMGLHKGCLPFYAMEFLDGITLEELLNRKNTLGLGAALEIFIAVGDALAYAHRHKIIHRDVKPANIMLVQGPNGAVDVKLLDFGIAELSEFGSSQGNSEVVGSSAYMSPEQFRGQLPTEATDIYSLACSLFETLAGDAPFDGENFEELRQQHQEQQAPTLKEFTGQDFPVDIEAVLEHALRKDPVRRYRYMSEMIVDMRRILEGKPLQFAGWNKVAGVFENSASLGHGLDELELADCDEGELNGSGGFFLALGGKRGFLVVASCIALVLIVGLSYYLYAYTGAGAAVNQLLGLTALVSTGASAQPKYFRLMEADYKKLGFTESFSSNYDYYLFPPDGEIRLGRIAVLDSSGEISHSVAASGLVKLEKGANRSNRGLILSSEIGDNLELLRRFHSDELMCISFSLSSDQQDRSGVESRSRIGFSSGRTGKILDGLRHFRSLRMIDLGLATVNENSVEILNDFTELEVLILSDVEYDSLDSFPKLRCFSRLKVLHLPSLAEDASSVLHYLASARQMIELELRKFTCSEKELSALSGLTRLRKFGCGYSIVPTKLVQKLAKFPSIEELDFRGCHLSPEAAAILLSMKDLKKLVLALDIEDSWGAARFNKFLRDMRAKRTSIEFAGLSGTVSSSAKVLSNDALKQLKEAGFLHEGEEAKSLTDSLLWTQEDYDSK